MKKNLRFVLALAIGWLTSVGAMAIEPVDGVYQIGSAQDWAEFCTLHNDGTNQRLNAVLTADVTVDGNAMVGINGGGKPYRGTFDGQGHKLIVSYNLDEERVAPFRRINGATIKNLIVEGTITTTSKLASGLVGGLWQSGTTIQNCVSYVTINDTNSGDATHGGICGSFEDVNGANVIENCAFFGAINAPNREGCGGLVGWTNQSNNTNIIRNCLVAATLNVKKESNNDVICRNNAIVINCYYLGSIDGLKNDKGAVAATDAQAQSGELCYLLNQKQSETPAWFQKIGTDAKPTAVGTDIVYANGELKCDGITPKEGSSLSFSNTANSTVDEHSFVDGICTVCSALQEIEGFYQIGCAAALNRYSEIVRTTNGGAKAVLTKDIDMTDQVWTPIGQDGHDFQGHFNGQGHRIKNLKTDANNNNQALFGQAIGGTIIENVIIDASCVIKGGSRTAGILSQVWGDNVIIRNCGNEANIEGSQENCAGIVGCSQGKVIHISNCYNTGSITGNRENAGICAWMGSDNSTISNCYSTATNVNGEALWRKGEVKGENMFQIEGIQGTAFTAADLASGKLAYMLNGNKSTDVVWYQVIGTDANPVPCAKEGGVVYANGELDCAGNAKAGSEETYSNTEGATRDEHQFADGFCTACGAFDANYIAETDGAYNLASAKDVKWFAALVNSGSGNANARLTADVDFADVTFTGIGNGSNHFTGTFDGQGHIVKNMVIDQPEESNIGFFNEIDNGAVIKNFTIDASCSVKGKAFTGAFVGHVSGNGSALLECLGNEGTVETVNQNAGALVGCNTSGELKLTIKNCYNAGAIKSGNEAGGLSGWFGNDAITENCYNMGTVINGESYARGNNIQITNCFDAVTSWPALNKVNIEDFTNGVVYAKLAEAAPYVWFLSAAEGGHPVLYATEWQTVIVKSDYAGNEVADGDFFIYNPTSGLWLQNNDKNTGDWNTRGATGDYGFEFGISAIDGGYKLDPKFGHNHSMNISNFYLDTQSDVSAWKLEKLNTNEGVIAYQIKADDGRVLSLNNDNNLDWNTGRAAEWQLVTKADRIKFMKENASEENPIDATFLISDPRFVNENERAAAWNWDMNLDGGARDDVRWYRNRRSYAIWNSKSFKLTQVIANVPNGQYKLTLKGYYRDGDKDQVVARRQAGEERILANYFINEDKAPMMSILDGASENWVDGLFFYPAADAAAPYGYYPDNADGFNRIFQDYPNSYLNAGVTSQVTTGQMTIGLEKLEKNEKDWLAFDDFSLVYMGNSMGLEEYLNALRTAIEAAEAFDATTTSTALAGALADALSDAKAKLTSVEEGEIETATANLNAALNAAKAVNITVLKKTTELAEAEGINVDAARTAISEATTSAPVDNALNSLRIARRVNAADIHENVFKGNQPAEGDFYLYNVGAKRFLCGGDDWGAHCVVGFPGQLLTFTGTDGNYRIDTHLSNGGNSHYLGYNGYMDTDATTTWTLVSTGKDGVYVLARTESQDDLLGYDTTTYNIVHSDRHDSSLPENQWILVSVAERDALIELASEENPVDLSYKIQAPGFDQRASIDKWAMTDISIWGRGGNHPDFACESWNKESNKLSQTIEGLPSGNYKVSVQGFFRDGNLANQVELISASNEPAQLASLYAGEQSIQLPNIVAEKDMVPGIGVATAIGELPDNCDQACNFFQLGLYKVELDVVVGNDGKLEIGVSKNSKNFDEDWVVVDNFRLVYFGDPAKAALEAAKDSLAALIATAKAIDTTGKTSESATALSNAITNAETALAAENATVESLTTAKTNLQTAINNLADIVNGINAIESAAQAGKAFNMQGQQVKKAQKGVYIINNKKVVVK
ncbi:FIVAR domain-containing protein [Xylanibacter brevis]|uniref:FIVAR domain-containing protein n=1 Tax=Xylanibacter brevis TaxID=83231 RepID=UPI00048048BA|nr:FIVAR domain-containing protein [Xylanibacter brevis]